MHPSDQPSSADASGNTNAHAQPAQVILIHGAGAGDRNDEKPHWWQEDSPFALDLAEKLGGDFEIATPFQWGEGGMNSEQARREGGAQLYDRLRELEASGRDYHLVGHSHGGIRGTAHPRPHHSPDRLQ